MRVNEVCPMLIINSTCMQVPSTPFPTYLPKVDCNLALQDLVLRGGTIFTEGGHFSLVNFVLRGHYSPVNIVQGDTIHW